jgi:putative ABC transport system permease protein
MNVLFVASRNVLRNRRRSILTLLAASMGTIAVLLFWGYYRDNERGLQTATVRSYGHLQIVVEDFLAFGHSDSARFSIHGYSALIETIRHDPTLEPMLELVTPMLKVEGVVGNFALGTSTVFVGEGVVPTERQKQLAWDGLGKGFAPDASALRADVPDGGVVGVSLAQLLGLCDQLGIENCKRVAPNARQSRNVESRDVDDALPSDIAAIAADADAKTGSAASEKRGPVLELLASTAAGLPNVVRMNVLRAERNAIRDIDVRHVAMPLALAQRLVFGTHDPGASAIIIQLRHTDMLEPARRRLQELLKNSPQRLEVVSFHEVSPEYDQIVASFRAIFGFIAVLMAAITLFLIANVVSMAVGERVGEIGALRSLGFQRFTIRRIFLIEGGLLGLLGALTGAAGAVALALAINGSGLSWTPPGRQDAIGLRVELFSDPVAILIVIAAVAVIACLSAVWPANHAAKLEITAALRHS